MVYFPDYGLKVLPSNLSSLILLIFLCRQDLFDERSKYPRSRTYLKYNKEAPKITIEKTYSRVAYIN